MRINTLAFSLALVAAPLTAAAQTPAYPPPPPLDPQQPPPQAPPPQQGVYVAVAPPPPAPNYAPVYGPAGYAPGYRLARPVLVPYEEGTPVPPGARIVTRPRIGLVVAGAVTFGSVWLLTAMVGTLAGSDYYRSGSQPELWLVAPVLGPFAYLAADNNVSSVGAFWLVFDGLVQGAGLAMLIAGIARPGQYLAYDRVAHVAPSWSITPGLAGLPGASFRMTF